MKKLIDLGQSNDLKNLEGFAKSILSYNQKKYSMFKDMADKHGWDSVYVNDIRYDLLRMAIMDFHISKGFFTISDLTGITDLNIRSIERFLKKIVFAGYLGKRSSVKDKRVVEYFAADRSLLLLKVYLRLLKEGAGLFKISPEKTAEFSDMTTEELEKYLAWSEDKV